MLKRAATPLGIYSGCSLPLNQEYCIPKETRGLDFDKYCKTMDIAQFAKPHAYKSMGDSSFVPRL
jgi:hypothetical protein